MSFDKIFDLTAGVNLIFIIITSKYNNMHPSLSEIPCLLLLLYYYYCSACPPPTPACPPPRPPPQILLTLSSTPPLRFSPTPPAEELLRYHAITLYRCLTEEPKWPFSGRFQSVLVPLSMLRATLGIGPGGKNLAVLFYYTAVQQQLQLYFVPSLSPAEGRETSRPSHAPCG